MSARRLALLAREIHACRLCPRLVAHREAVAEKKRRAYLADDYWGRPVAGFGDPKAKIVILGLAPGAHGANRTGRVFTGDRSGDFLYAALHRAGLASQPTSERIDDGLVLSNVWITLAARCVPPDNHPSPAETATCGRTFLDRELAILEPRVVLALGAIAWNAYLDSVGLRPRPPFSHGGRTTLPGGGPVLLGSYHVSQQNTQTGRLTGAMFDVILRQVVMLAEADPRPSTLRASSRDHTNPRVGSRR